MRLALEIEETCGSSLPATGPAKDGSLRGRLRSILRRRIHLRGRGRDHQRWPNLFFANTGQFSLKTAHTLASQPSRR